MIDQDFKNPAELKNKLAYLAQRQTRGTNKKVQLFVGVSLINFKYAKSLMDELDPETKRNVKLFQISDKPEFSFQRENKSEKILFS